MNKNLLLVTADAYQYHEARKKCPDIVLVPASPGKYSSACKQLITIWERFSPLIELFSIDEAFLDVTGCESLMGDPLQIAIRLKNETWDLTGLTCSVGIARNKLLAKLGSDMLKPDGIVLISPGDEQVVLEDLPVNELCGIAPKLTQQLAAMGCGGVTLSPEDGLANLRDLLPRLAATATVVVFQDTPLFIAESCP